MHPKKTRKEERLETPQSKKVGNRNKQKTKGKYEKKAVSNDSDRD